MPAARDSDPERLQQVCTDLEDSLAEVYKELAESWLRHGQPQKAAAALKILRMYPDGRQAKFAHDEGPEGPGQHALFPQKFHLTRKCTSLLSR